MLSTAPRQNYYRIQRLVSEVFFLPNPPPLSRAGFERKDLIFFGGTHAVNDHSVLETSSDFRGGWGGLCVDGVFLRDTIFVSIFGHTKAVDGPPVKRFPDPAFGFMFFSRSNLPPTPMLKKHAWSGLAARVWCLSGGRLGSRPSRTGSGASRTSWPSTNNDSTRHRPNQVNRHRPTESDPDPKRSS